jgi:hypothetical protein
MILGWDNKVDGSSMTVGSEIATLPGTNVKVAHLSQKWYTAAAVNSSFLVFDLGAAYAIAFLAVLGTNLTSAATYRLRASNADPTAVGTLLYDSGTVSAGVKTGYGAIYKAVTLTTARYWRLDLTDASLTQLQIGRVFLGPAWDISRIQYGWSVGVRDNSPVARSRGGQSFPDVLPQTRVLEFMLDFLTEAEIFDNAFAAARANGQVKDLLAVPIKDGTYVSEQSVWGLVQAFDPVVNPSALVFRQKFTIEERL